MTNSENLEPHENSCQNVPHGTAFWGKTVVITTNCINVVLGRACIDLTLVLTLVVEIEANLNKRPPIYRRTLPIQSRLFRRIYYMEDKLNISRIHYIQMIETVIGLILQTIIKL